MGSWYWQESGCGSRWQQSPGIKQQRRNRGSSPGPNANLTLISLFLFCWLLFPLACFTHSFLSMLSLLMSPHLNLRCFCVHSFSKPPSVSSHLCLIHSPIPSSSTETSLGSRLRYETSSIDMWHLGLAHLCFYINSISFTECEPGWKSQLVMWHTLPAFQSIQNEMDLTLTPLLCLLNCTLLSISVQLTYLFVLD